MQINKGRKEFKPRTTACRSTDGILLNERDAVLKRWSEYFQTLLNGPLAEITPSEYHDSTTDISQHLNTLVPTLEDVECAINKLKNNKAPGVDSIPGELIKYAGVDFEREIHRLISIIWQTETMPDEWNMAVICPLHKKGDILACQNYRGISLLNTAYKVFANVLLSKIIPYVEPNLNEYQCGFRPNRSTTDQIFSLRQILERTHEFNIETHHLFIDFKAANDNVKRSFLYEAMTEIGIPLKLVSLTRMTLTKTISAVRVQTDISEPFETFNGLRQGDALSCVLFNIVLDKCIRDSQIETTGTIYQKSVQVLGYADDLDLIGRTFPAMEMAYLALENAARQAGLHVNMKKTKYLKASKNQSLQPQTVSVGNNTFAAVKDFVYLGSTVTEKNEISTEINRRIMAANRCYFGLRRYFRSKLLSRRTKVLLYKTLLRPVLTYGSETWVLSKKDEHRLLVFERGILRRMFGAVQEDGCWRIRYNHELYNMYSEPNIAKVVKLGRLRWLGHVERMEETRPPKRLLEGKPDGRRSRGRPKLRWLDGVEHDLKNIGVRGWKQKAKNRTVWRDVLDQAKAHSGL